MQEQNIKMKALDDFSREMKSLVEAVENWKITAQVELEEELEKKLKSEAEKIQEKFNQAKDALWEQFSKGVEKIKESTKEHNAELIQYALSENTRKIDEFLNKKREELSQKFDEFITQEKKNFEFIDKLKENVKSIEFELENIRTKFLSLQRDYALFNEQIKNGFENGLFSQKIIERIARLEALINEKKELESNEVNV